MDAGLVRKVDASQLLAKLERARVATPLAARGALEVMLQDVAMKVVRGAPRDTQRYIRGWTMAFNDVGVKGLPPVMLRKSRQYGKQLMMLVKQAELWEKRAAAKRGQLQAWYLDKKRPLDRYGVRLEKQVIKLEEIARRAREEVQRFTSAREPVILIGRSSGEWGKRHLATTRTKVYGGDGLWIVTSERVLVRLRNREPHARIVESKTKVMWNAMTAARTLGARNARDHFARAVAAASGMHGGAGVGGGKGFTNFVPAGPIRVL